MNPSFSISYDEDGGTAVPDETVRCSERLEEPATPSKSGYIFGGWFSDAALASRYNFDDDVRHDLTLYANWIAGSGTAATVTTEPEGGLLVGGSHDLTASASGTPAPTTRWQRSDALAGPFVSIPGATSGEYTATEAGYYRAVFRNGVAPDALSAVVQVLAPAAPVFTSDQGTTPARVGVSSVVKTVTASGVPAPTFSLAMTDSSPVPSWLSIDEASGEITVDGTAATHTDAGSYDVIVTAANGVSPDASQPLTITLNAAPVVVSQPVGGGLDADGEFIVTAHASGVPEPTVQWESATSATGPWSAATGASANADSYRATSEGFYRARFTNSEGSVFTEVIEVTASTFTVFYDSRGGSPVDSQMVVAGGTATEPPAPARDSFTFAGWFTDPAGSVAYSFAAPVLADVTVYAGWAPVVDPTVEPTVDPTVGPTIEPTVGPTTGPTPEPTVGPTTGPTLEPTQVPSVSLPATGGPEMASVAVWLVVLLLSGCGCLIAAARRRRALD